MSSYHHHHDQVADNAIPLPDSQIDDDEAYITPISTSPPPATTHTVALVDKYGKKIKFGHASILACTAALANTILGAGMLGLPHAFASSGYILGLILLVVSGCASAFALHLLAVSAKTVGIVPASFYTVAHAAVPRATFLIDAAVAVKCFGVQTSYLIVVGDLMPSAASFLFGHSSGIIVDRRLWIAIAMIIIVLPLSCLRTLNSLRFTSSMSIIFVAFLTIVIGVYAWIPGVDPCSTTPTNCHGPTSYFLLNMNTAKILSIFVFGFTCHQNIFPVCNEIIQPTQRRINSVISMAIFIAFVLYVCIAVSGYHSFGSNVESNILNNYPDSLALSIARVLVSINVCFTFPLQCHPCRSSIFALYGAYKKERKRSLDHHRSGKRVELPVSTDKKQHHEQTYLLSSPSSSSLLSNESKAINGNGALHSSSSSHISSTTAAVDMASPLAPEADDEDDDEGSKVVDDVFIPTSNMITVVTGILCAASFGIAMVVNNLGVILAIVGATGSTTISYILPGIVYMRLHSEWTPKKIAAAILFGAGCIIIPSCLVFIFL